MGCVNSSAFLEERVIDGHRVIDNSGINDFTAFKQYSYDELHKATNGFNPGNIISERGDKMLNWVYKGRLTNSQWVVVKRFPKSTWPEAKQFAEEARVVGQIRHPSLTSLLGFCCDGDDRLLVAEFLPNETLSKHLFHWEKRSLPWATRLMVALYTAEALDFCFSKDRPLYHDLNTHKVLFDGDGKPHLSCFGLIKINTDKSNNGNPADTPPECSKTGTFLTPESVIYYFGIILLDLLSGKHIPPSHALDLIKEKNISAIIDSCLEGQYSVDHATELIRLTSRCLQAQPWERPATKAIVATLNHVCTQFQESGGSLMGLGEGLSPTDTLLKNRELTPLAKALSRMDLTTAHELFLKAGYRDNESLESELSFYQWTEQRKMTLDTKNKADVAFRDKNWETAIEKYTELVEEKSAASATLFARRSLSYLFLDQVDPALRDAMQAQMCASDWPTAFYLQSAALAKLGMNKDSQEMLNKGVDLEW